MGGFRLKHAVCLAASMLLPCLPTASLAAPTEVGGGGGRGTDCLATFIAEVNLPAANPRHVRCVDGDPACDADLTVDGVCTLPLIVCANSTFSPNCTLSDVGTIVVDHALDNGDLKFDPDFQALQARIDNDIQPPNAAADVCTTASNIRVPIKGPLGNNRCSRGKTKKVKVTTQSQPISGRVYRDIDVIKFQCDPSPSLVGGGNCDPQLLFAGTFDRIQKQVLNQNCALSGCHDSQSFAGGLLLETGAAYTNLVNLNEDCIAMPSAQGCPLNFSARNAGWKRVATVPPVMGQPLTETSFLFHKIEGSLPNPGYGERMPLDRPRLHPTLRNVIEQWILGGAPENGWVPGTF